MVPVAVDTPAFLPAVVVVPIPTECLLMEVVPFSISNALTVAMPVTRKPSLAVMTPTESMFATSS